MIVGNAEAINPFAMRDNSYTKNRGFNINGCLLYTSHVSFHVVVEKHSLLVGIQQQAVAAVRVDVVDVGMQQQRRCV